MTLEQVREFEGQVVSVRTRDPMYGGGEVLAGRLEILDDTTFQVVGQPKISGLPLGDAMPIKALIANVTEITPVR